MNCGYFWSPWARLPRVFRWLKVGLGLYCNSQECLQCKQTDKQGSVNGCRCLGWCGAFKCPIGSHTDRADRGTAFWFSQFRTIHALSFGFNRGWKRSHSQKWVQMKKIDYLHLLVKLIPISSWYLYYMKRSRSICRNWSVVKIENNLLIALIVVTYQWKFWWTSRDREVFLL